MSDCVFCKIASHQIPSEAVYEDEEFFAFKDINPAAPVHFLLIPKRHLDSLLDPDAGSDLIGRMLKQATAVARKLGLAEKGFRVVINTGDNGGQTVHHLHFHILGGRFMKWPPG